MSDQDNNQDLPIAFSGEIMLLGWAESSSKGRTVSFRLADDEPEHPFRRMDVTSGKQAGQRFMAVLVKIDDDETPDKSVSQKKFGKHAHELYRAGWMFNKHVLRACGTEDEFAVWVSRQPCTVCKAAAPSSVIRGQGFIRLPVCNLHRQTDIAAIANKNTSMLKGWVSYCICRIAGTDSLGEIMPTHFMKICTDLGIANTVPETYMNPDY